MIKDLNRKKPQLKPLETSTSVHVLRELEQFRRAEAGKKWARDAKGMEVLAAYLGKTQGMLNRNGLWEQIQLTDGEIWATVPLFSAMMRSIAKEALRSKPLYALRGDFADVDEQEVARYGTTIIEYLSKRFWTSEEEQEDVLASMSFGFGGYEVDWDPDAGEAQSLVEVLCQHCGTSGFVHKSDINKGDVDCPDQECAGQMVAGKDIEIPAGDVVLRRVDPFCWNSNTWATKERLAIWWAIDEILDRAVWEDLHPEIDAPGTLGNGMVSGATLGEDLIHLRRQRAIQRAQMGLESSIASSRGRSEMTSERDVVRQRDFFAPAVYKRRVTGLPETLPSGRVIEGNTALIELFPKGMCILRDGANKVLDIYPANPEKSLHLYNFAVKPNDRWGASVAAQALECQYALEEDLSQLQTVASEMGNPTMFYDESLFDGRLGSHPSGKHPVHRRLTERGLSDLIHYAPPGIPSPVIFQLVLFYEQRMQGVLGASSGSGGGLPDAVGPTATANANARAESMGQQGQFLELRAAAKMAVLEEGVSLFAEHADIRRAISMGGPFADGAVLQLDKSMLPKKLSLEVKRDSWWPRDRGQEQQAELLRHQMIAAANQTALMMTGKPITAIEERYIADLCGSDIGSNLAQLSAELAVREWKKAKAFIDRAVSGPFALDDPGGALMAKARATLMEEAASAMAEHQMMQKISALGAAQPPAGLAGGTPAPQPGGPIPDVGPMGEAAPMPTAPPQFAQPAPPPMAPPEPPIEQVILGAADLSVPVRPGLTLAARGMADQLRYEALKVATRELPDVYLDWLDRRASEYDELARNQKQAEAAVGAPPEGPPGPPANGSGNVIGDALNTKLAAIQQSGAPSDGLGLPGPPAALGPPAAGDGLYG